MYFSFKVLSIHTNGRCNIDGSEKNMKIMKIHGEKNTPETRN